MGLPYDSSLPRITSVSSPSSLNWPHVYFGVALTTLATLLLELSLTRIFSVVFYYHFAFLAISIALFGLGAGGVFSYVVAGWRGTLFAKLGGLAVANGFLAVLSLLFVLSRSGEPGNVTLALVYFASALPFLLAGAIISLAISETIERVDRVYFFDLLGAAAGCLVLVPLLNSVGGPNTVIVAAIVFAVSSAIWFNLGGLARGRAAGVLSALALFVLLLVNLKLSVIDVQYAKGQTLQDERFVKWNSFSRIAVAPEKGSDRMSIVIDADAATGIAKFDFDKLTAQQREDLLHQGPGLPYVLRPGAKTLIIGPGGGWDVSRALASGSKDVTGVEINPIIARTVMQERFPQLSNRLYFRPEVHIVVEDGRSYIQRSQEKYQVLQATLVDTWASTAAGAFALSENNLYTTDAFHAYLSHLTDDGVLTFTRWGFEPPRESLRLLTLAMDALARLGEREPWRHVVVGREGSQAELQGWGTRDTVLISRKPFSAADVALARTALQRARMQAVYLPGDVDNSPFAQLLRASDQQAFLRQYPYDVSPVGDDRPFFFYTVQPQDLWRFATQDSAASADYKINRAVPLLFGLMGISLAATLIILALPPVLLGSRLPSHPGARRLLWYFFCIGVGYILVQVALIQKFVLFLGHPTYALTVIIFSMLVASGLGSYASRRLLGDDSSKLMRVLGGVAICVAALAFLAPVVTQVGITWPLSMKMAVAALLISPAAFLMGMPFPTGLRRLEELHHPSVRWAWSLNAAASVLGSASAIFLAVYIGLRATMLVGGLLYAAALVVVAVTLTARTSQQEPAQAR